MLQLQAVLLVQLLVWAVSVQAFFPWYPPWLCADDNICDHQDADHHETEHSATPVARAALEGAAVSFKLTQRIPRGDEPLEHRVSRAAKRLVRKYSAPGRSSPVLAKKDNKFTVETAATPKATNAAGLDQDGTDFSYFIEAGFGSGNTPLYMLVDTGAGTTWVMGSNCESSACTMHDSYGPTDSKTFQSSPQAFSIAYGSGNVAGYLASDSISIAGIKATMSFGVANVTSNDFTHFPFDGILGLSMSKGATDNFMATAKDQKLLQSNVFAVYLNRASDGPNTGEVMFGATDPDKYTGDIAYTPVSSKGGGDWSIPLDNVLYGDSKAGVTGRLAYIDTGTTYIFGPPADVAALHKQIPGAKSSDGVTYTVPCTSNQPLGVVFSGVTYAISAKDWLSPPSSGGSCTSNIYGHEVVSGSWLLGDLFLKNVYAVFDMDQERIGFAAKPAASSPSTSATSAGATSSNTAPTSVQSTTLATLTTSTPPPGSSTTPLPSPLPPPSSDTSFPGLSGHETSATAVAETAAPSSSPSPTQTSPGEQLEGSTLVSMVVVVVAAIAVAI